MASDFRVTRHLFFKNWESFLGRQRMHELDALKSHECTNDDCVRVATNARIIILRG